MRLVRILSLIEMGHSMNEEEVQLFARLLDAETDTEVVAILNYEPIDNDVLAGVTKAMIVLEESYRVSGLTATVDFPPILRALSFLGGETLRRGLK